MKDETGWKWNCVQRMGSWEFIPIAKHSQPTAGILSSHMIGLMFLFHWFWEFRWIAVWGATSKLQITFDDRVASHRNWCWAEKFEDYCALLTLFKILKYLAKDVYEVFQLFTLTVMVQRTCHLKWLDCCFLLLVASSLIGGCRFLLGPMVCKLL